MATAPLKRASIPLVAVGALVASIAAASSPLVSSGTARAMPPNIVVVMSDDQPYWTVGKMPFVSGLDGLEAFGALYDNFALCCPARASFLTGLYSHHTGVEQNRGEAFDDTSTLATWLDEAGYRTGLFGKYLNGYPFDRGVGYVPPGWDRWLALEKTAESGYYDYVLYDETTSTEHGSEPDDYSTDVIAEAAEDFVLEAPEPFFALVAPHGPHNPFTPAPRHVDSLAKPPWPVSPNFDRPANRAPSYYRELPHVKSRKERRIAQLQLDTLLSVDELAERVVTAADQRGDTIFLYLSDNGLSLGSHRVTGKRCGYEECGRVPGLIRAPGDPSDVLAANVDLAPTLAELAGVDSPPTDGESLLDDMQGTPPDPDRAVLLRNSAGGRLPIRFWGLRTERWKYLEHGPKAGKPAIELYDLDADPNELRNLHGKPAHAATEASLKARLQALRSAPPAN